MKCKMKCNSLKKFRIFAEILCGSTLATLWAVKDESTAKFMVEFYRQLNKRISKAEALRQAQITFLKDKTLQHPFYWAPFILVGNWI